MHAEDISQSEPLYLQHKVFGGKGAFQFQPDETRSQVPTLRFEAAKSVGPRKYDWSKDNKIQIQLTERELPILAAVLLGAQPSCVFDSHGPEKNKALEVHYQPDSKNFFVKARHGQNLVAVPMGKEDAYYVLCLVIKQITASKKGLDSLSTITLIRSVFGRA